MAHDNHTKRRVRSHFVQGMPLTTAAQTVNVPYNTVRRWKASDAARGDDWDLERNARRMMREGVASLANEVLNELAVQFLATLEVLKADKQMPADKRAQILVQLMDGYHKAIHASARAMPEANQLAVAMDVVKFLSAHVAQQAPDIRERFLAVVESAGDALVSEFGTKR